MEQKILDAALRSFMDEFIRLGKSFFSDTEKELLHSLRLGLNKYLKAHKTKFTSIKTILQGSTPVYLYDFYFPLMLVRNDLKNKYKPGITKSSFGDWVVISTASVSDLFIKSNYVTIMGDAGSGKSTLVKHLFLNCIMTKYAVPFLLELRYLNDFKGSIEEYIVSKIFENNIAENYNILTRMLKNGKFVFFLDGYDELNANIKERIVNELDDFITKYPENKFILTSRPYSNIEHFQKFTNYHVKSLDANEIDEFIKKQLPKEQELAGKIMSSIKENQNEYIKSFLTNPLLLSLYILTYQSNSDIPPKKYIFYRRVIQALFSEHDSRSKIGYKRERKTDLTQEQFEEILKRFSFLSFFEAKYDFEFDYITDLLAKIKVKLITTTFDNNNFIADLKSALALWVEDNGTYSFAHRSMQEYYVATFIKRLDAQNKEKIYTKIISKTGNGLSSETRNLLGLCEEMDPYYFNLYYKLPILNSLKETLADFPNPTQACVNHLVKSFEFDYNQRSNTFEPLDVNPNIYKYLYFHLSFMQDLYERLLKFGRYISDNNKTKKKVFVFKDLNKEFPKQLSEFCVKEGVEQSALDLFKWLDKEIELTIDFITKTEESNDELVGMI